MFMSRLGHELFSFLLVFNLLFEVEGSMKRDYVSRFRRINKYKA